MSAEVLYEVMGLKGDTVEGVWEDAGTIRVQVAAPREALSCGQCGCQRVHVHERSRREWKSAPWGTTPVVITMDSPKVKCLRCHSKTWHQPTFANGQRRVTKTFEKTLQTWLSKLTLQDAATMFGVAWHTVSEVDLREPATPVRGRPHHRPGTAG